MDGIVAGAAIIDVRQLETTAVPTVQDQAPPVSERLEGRTSGPTLFCVGSLHGNEPAGARAIERVAQRIREEGPLANGDLVTAIGNPTAMAAKQRYIDRDLNRLWTDTRVARLREKGPTTVEGGLTLQLADLTLEVERDARGKLYLLDLHTTSGDSPPFSNAIDRLNSRKLAMSLAAPTVLGIEEQLDGTLIDWLDHRGFVGTVFESGQHDDPASIARAEAALWLCLDALGMIDLGSTLAETVRKSRTQLEETAAGLPRMVELTYRHALDDRSAFEMLPGYRSFQEIRQGEHLAWEMEDPVHAPHAGRILMPLYQPQGDEGFFLMNDYGPQLRVASQLLRRAGLLDFVHTLPGVFRDKERPGWLVLERSASRGPTRNLLRLLGYRRERSDRGVVQLAR